MTLDETDKSVTFILNLMLEWEDDRFYITGPDPDNTPNILEVPVAQYHQIHRPTLMFLNSFKVEKLPIVGDNEFHYFWFYGDKFEYAEYLKFQLGCNFDFSYFPFDSHVCDLKYYSPSYDVSFLSFETPTLQKRWKQDKEYNGSLSLTKEALRIPFEVTLQGLAENETLEFMTYEYNTAGVRLTFKRSRVNFLVSGYFVPSGVFAVFSILSMLLGKEQVGLGNNMNPC